MKTEYDENYNINRMGFYSSIFLTVITLITFGFAITAIPISGINCPDCLEYPYLDTLSQFPGDYLWMFPATLLILTYLIFIVSVHSFASRKNKIFSRISLAFAIISSVVLLSCYFIQFSVIPASLMNGETEGIALLTQYNPHGVFIALEELGYLMMSFSFLFIAPVFTNNNRVENSIRWIFIIAFILATIAFAFVTIKHGIVRKDRFEIMVILINWLVLMTNGILTSIVFKRALKQIKSE
ncbi:Uncharacterised protein [uncultured archaeon]|nr:Uncharacterised protein [uncultured archaeon]